MYTNQDIYKIHSSNQLSKIGASTTLMLLPLRIETKFKNKRHLRGFDQYNVLFPLKDIWECINAIERNNRQALELHLGNLLFHLNRQEIVTHEDKQRLVSLVKMLKKNIQIAENDKIKKLLDDIGFELDTLIDTNAVKVNKATIFIKELRHHALEIERIMDKHLPYNGKMRDMSNNYSSTAFYKSMTKHMGDARKFFNHIEGRIQDIPQFDAKQRKRFSIYMEKLTAFNFDIIDFENIKDNDYVKEYFNTVWDVKNEERYEEVKKQILSHYINANILKLSEKKRKHEVFSKKEKSVLKSYETFLNSFQLFKNEVNDEKVKDYKKLVKNKSMLSKRYTKLTYYTVFAVSMMRWRISYLNKGIEALSSETLENLTNRLKNTLFSFQEEKDWVGELVNYYNEIAEINKIAGFESNIMDNCRACMYNGALYKHQTDKCLCVRIYPDILAVTQFEKDLTSVEIEDAKTFLNIYFENCGNFKYVKQKQAAWDWICQRYTPYRAAWIIRSVAKNYNIKPVEKKQMFTIPVSQLMPDRFSVQVTVKISEEKEQTFCFYGKNIPEVLQCGFNLNHMNTNDSDNQIVVQDERLKFRNEIRWMTDYNEAERMGMAVTIPLSSMSLTKKGNERKFDITSVYVTGYKYSVQGEAVNDLLAEVMDAHIFSEEGLDIVPTGTPTNILNSDTDTTYDTSTEKQKKIFFDVVKRSLFKVRNNYKWEAKVSTGSDIKPLNQLFKFSDQESPFGEVTHCDTDELYITQQANGYLLDYYSTDNCVIKYIADNNLLRKFFCENVIPNGYFPTLRIGNQPYGLIPVGDFRNIKFPKESREMIALLHILNFLSEKWNAIARQNNISDSSNQYRNTKEFMKTISGTPSSNLFYEQDSVRYDDFLDPEFFRGVAKGINPFVELAKFFSMLWGRTTPREVPEYIPNSKYIPIKDSYRPIKKEAWIETPKNLLIEKIPSLKERPDFAETLVIGFFDLFCYRLDAWMQGILNYRLQKSENILIGCFGWVFDLKETTKKDRQLGEFLLAPSINQAITASVLKGAYNNAKDSNKNDADVMTMNINLSSIRVRKALRIVDGVRNGLPVGAILGADLERILHDATTNELDQYIWPLRLSFPLVQNIALDEKIVQSLNENSPTVINGSSLLKSLRDWVNLPDNRQSIGEYFNNNLLQFDNWWKNNVSKNSNSSTNKATVFNNPNHRTALIKAFQEVYDSYDALMDVILSESIYQLCQGNTEVVTALMNALEKETLLPLPTVTEIPVNHARIENKVIACVKTDQKQYPDSPLAMADSSLNNWFKSILGYNVESFEKFGISASDIVYLSKEAECFDKYLSYKCGEMASSLKSKAEELRFIAGSIRRSLSTARLLRNEDLMVESPDGEVKNIVCLEEVKEAVAWIRSYAEEVIAMGNELLSVIGNNIETMLNEDLIAKAKIVFAMGYKLGMYDQANNLDDLKMTEINDKLVNFLTIIQVKLNNFDSVLTGHRDETDAKTELTIKDYTEALRKLMTGDVLIVPALTIDTEYVPQVSLQQTNFSNVNDTKLDNWIMDMADVRSSMQDVYQQKLYTDWLSFENNSIVPPTYHPLQLVLDDESAEKSSKPNARIKRMNQWLGGCVDNEDKVKDANVYMVLNATELQQKTVRGMVLDFWTEKIPLRDQTAGLAFSFDQPDAEPAQAIILSTARDLGKCSCWTEERIRRSIKCAKHMIETRSIEPDHLRNDKWASSIFPIMDPLS